MMNEDYVNFETAKLLKEKGFDENCAALYHLRTGEIIQQGVGYVFNNSQWENFITAPTIQMAMKWLREKRCIIVLNPILFTSYGCKKWSFSVWADDNLEIDGEDQNKRIEFDSYEAASEAAIKYCLEKLI